MNAFYVDSKKAQKYNMDSVAILGDKTITQLRNDMAAIPVFCRDETSIEVNDLKSYLGNGITLYVLNLDTLSGIINFDVNVDKVIVSGLCVPGNSSGIGTKLISTIKTFARVNRMKTINLTCYGEVVNFYTKNGFKIQKQRTLSYDSDDSDDEEEKISYDMIYDVTSGGKNTKQNKTKQNKTKQNKKIRKNKTKQNKTKQNKKDRKSRRQH
jgi:hypothetical protein